MDALISRTKKVIPNHWSNMSTFSTLVQIK